MMDINSTEKLLKEMDRAFKSRNTESKNCYVNIMRSTETPEMSNKKMECTVLFLDDGLS